MRADGSWNSDVGMQPRIPCINRWELGCSVDKTPSSAMEDIVQALSAHGICFKRPGPYTLHCRKVIEGMFYDGLSLVRVFRVGLGVVYGELVALLVTERCLTDGCMHPMLVTLVVQHPCCRCFPMLWFNSVESAWTSEGTCQTFRNTGSLEVCRWIEIMPGHP